MGTFVTKVQKKANENKCLFLSHFERRVLLRAARACLKGGNCAFRTGFFSKASPEKDSGLSTLQNKKPKR